LQIVDRKPATRQHGRDAILNGELRDDLRLAGAGDRLADEPVHRFGNHYFGAFDICGRRIELVHQLARSLDGRMTARATWIALQSDPGVLETLAQVRLDDRRVAC